eukprot:XP_001178436.2 PREDICTED: xanthine dehydrogenase/oxidase [Strongylocentrotus purpuratus]
MCWKRDEGVVGVRVRRLLNISNKVFENSKTLAEEEVSCSVRMETTEYGGSVLLFFCNGKKVIEKSPDPEMTLLVYLRKKLGLTGTKLGCAEGGCGACTVMVSSYDRNTSKIVHHAVNACLAPVCTVHGAAVTTVEGIGSTKTKLHPVQVRKKKWTIAGL